MASGFVSVAVTRRNLTRDVTSTFAQGSDITVTADYAYTIDIFGIPLKPGRLTSETTGRAGMTIDYRMRNIVIAAALAAAAVLLTVVYVASARSDTAAGKQNVTVYVPSKSFAVGTAGSRSPGISRQSRWPASLPRPTR